MKAGMKATNLLGHVVELIEVTADRVVVVINGRLDELKPSDVETLFACGAWKLAGVGDT